MNIAITTAGPSLESPVFADFTRTPCLLIVDVDTMSCTSVTPSPTPDVDCELARTVLAHRCEAVITGKLSEKAFDILADSGVTRFLASNMSAKEALEAMEQRALRLIRNPEGTDSCSGDHHH